MSKSCLSTNTSVFRGHPLITSAPREGGVGSGNVDNVREVAWIYSLRFFPIAERMRGRGSKIRKICGRYLWKVPYINFRFEEECTTVEEEDCRTVYDTVWEKKCEMVNVTVPQTACEEIIDVVMETK